MKTNAINFTGLLQYTGAKDKITTTVDTKNIIGIQQKKETPYETQILIKNTHKNMKNKPYAVMTIYKMPIKDVIIEYNKACRNELGDLGRIQEMEYLKDRNDFVV